MNAVQPVLLAGPEHIGALCPRATMVGGCHFFESLENTMLSNRQEIYNVVSTDFPSREFSRKDLLDSIDKHYPGTEIGSILPSDYLCRDAVKVDPSNDGNRDLKTYARFLERLGRNMYRFVGWDGVEKGSIDAPVLRGAADEQQNHGTADHAESRIAAPPFVFRDGEGTTDHARLVAALRQLAPSVRKSSDRAWCREAAVRVIDCVLSLNRRYDSFVVPRLDGFERQHPDIHSVSDLQRLIATYSSPGRFVAEALDYNDEARAAMLSAVVDWFVTVSGTGTYAAQLVNLEQWAAAARPGDYALLLIYGFGISGFQYLRMLFGGNTTKPDIHIRRFVASCVGHSVSDIDALLLLENAAPEAGVPLRDFDTTIWERSARCG